MGCSILPSHNRPGSSLVPSTEEDIVSETHEVRLEASSNQAGHSEGSSDGGLQPLGHSSLPDEHKS